MRLVLDTNILVCALISKIASPHNLLEAWKRNRFELITCEQQLEELQHVLSYEKLRRFLSAKDTELLLGELCTRAELVWPKTVCASRDPDDDVIAGCAVAAQADFLVTGDNRALLSLGQVETVRIVSARTMVDLFNQPPARAS